MACPQQYLLSLGESRDELGVKSKVDGCRQCVARPARADILHAYPKPPSTAPPNVTLTAQPQRPPGREIHQDVQQRVLNAQGRGGAALGGLSGFLERCLPPRRGTRHVDSRELFPYLAPSRHSGWQERVRHQILRPRERNTTGNQPHRAHRDRKMGLWICLPKR